MARLRLMKAGYGDQCLTEWDAGERETVEEASRLFAEQRRQGCLAFRLDGPGRQTAIDTFDAAAPEILLVPAVRGG